MDGHVEGRHKKIAMFDQSLYLGNDTRCGHSYNGRRIITRICDLLNAAISSNLKITTLFNVKLFEYDTKYVQ